MPDLADFTTTEELDEFDPQKRSPEDEAREKAERELCKRIDSMADDSREQRTKLQGVQVDAIRYWLGDQWLARQGTNLRSDNRSGSDTKNSKARRGKNRNQAVVNRIFPIIEQKIAMLTQNNPKGVFLPQNDNDLSFAKDIEELVLWRARRINMRTKLIRGCHDMLIMGYQAMYVFWDDSLPGKPDANVRLIDPQELIVDPSLTDTNVEDGSYVGYEVLRDLEYVKWRWPEHAERLQENIDSSKTDTFDSVQSVVSPLDREMGVTTDRRTYTESEDPKQDRPQVKLVSMWYRDYTEQEYEISTPFEVLKNDGTLVENIAGQWVYQESGEVYDPLEGPKTTTFEPAYPDGRFTIKVGDIILVDEPWSGLWPVVIGSGNILPHRWYGMNETEQLAGRQDVMNDLISALQDHTDSALFPRTLAEIGAVKDHKKIKSSPNSITWLNNGGMGRVQTVPPTSISGDVYRAYELNNADMENASGMSGVVMGRTPTKTSSATEIAALERAGQGRVGMMSAIFDEFISRVYLLMGQVIQKNYSPGQIIRVVGETNETAVITITQHHKEILYDVQVEAGSTLPFDKDRKKQDAVELNNILQGSYLPQVLDAYEVKDKALVLQTNQQWQMFMQLQPVLNDPNVQAAVQVALQGVQSDVGQGT